MARSLRGLMDAAIPAEDIARVKRILGEYQQQGVGFHALRSRQAAARKFLVVHLLVPGEWSIRQGHALADRFENDVRAALPNANIVTHIEPAGDPLSMQDADLDRENLSKAA
jgi:divalent metal cation (Fe/Co/Zn/Cd) transporter